MRIRLAVPIILLTIFQLLFAITGKGQTIATEKVTIGLKDESLEIAIKRIEEQSAFRFFYRNEDIDPLTHLDLTQDTRTIEQTLNALLQNTSLSFRQVDNNILLERKDQHTSFAIKGKVLNGITKKPVADASVFLNNATVGDKTANDGTFILQNAKPGNYQLVISIIGFETYTQNISVNSDINLRDILISPQTITLNEVKIKSKAIPQYYKWFKDEFLGTSALANQCKILNPEVLDLSYDAAQSTLSASSQGFLEIENAALGYKIKYLLNDFSLENKDKNDKRLHFDGSALFEEMKGTRSQQRRWWERRKEVYKNSAMHFLRAALADQITNEGFRALRIARYANPERPADSLIEAKIAFYKKLRSEKADLHDSLSYWIKKSRLKKIIEKMDLLPLKKEDIIKPTDQQGLFAIGFGRKTDELFITYNKNQFFNLKTNELQLTNDGNKENTLVSFAAPYAFFDNNGNIIVPGSLVFTGVWARERMAELLPVDYEPQSTNNTHDSVAVKNNNNQLSSTQPNALPAELIKLKTASDSISNNRSPEKMYIQFDKPYYSPGDTIWFKAYLLNAALTATDKSGFMYIDIANDSNKVVNQYKLPVQFGLSWGNISLDEKEFKTGTYTLRAYTNWMRNFGADCFFYKRFYIGGANENSWLVNKQESVSTLNGNNLEDVKLQLSDMNKKPFMVEPVELKVIEGERNLYKQKLQTDLNGSIDVNFTIPQKASGLAIIAESEKGERAVIPLNLNRAEHSDVQFLPEGGNLVAGLPANIGFKAIGEDGRAINISGIITDHNQKQVVEFSTLHNGMGSFELDIKNGEKYIAKVNLPGGLIKEYPLPDIKGSGTVLQMKNSIESDSLEVSLAATNDVVQSDNSYFLIGKARGIICYAAVLSFKNGSYIKRKIAKKLFPTGITHFTLMTSRYQPVNERLVFIDHKDKLNIQFKQNKAGYSPRDNVELKIKVTDNTGKPVEGSFSMSVTDNAQVKADTLNQENIITRLLLTSDLKGFVEEPGYYLSSASKEKWQALDNLLLTQGWIAYDWQEVFNPPALAYQPEHEFEVKGNVFNVFNKPVKGTDVLLFSKSPSMLIDTVTDKEGKFVFSHLPIVDTPIFILKAVNKRGKSFNVGIRADEIKPPVFTALDEPVMTPWYVNSDTALLNYTKNNVLAKQQKYAIKGLMLKEVKIAAKKIVKGSQNLNGAGNADIVIDEKELEKLEKKTLLDLFIEKIPGFRVNYIKDQMIYYIKYKWAVFIIDGTEFSQLNQLNDFNSLRRYFQSYSAEDIKGVEVNFSDKYSSVYQQKFRLFDDYRRAFAFVEITTRTGNSVIENAPDMYLFKAMPLSWPAAFYKPKYAVKNITDHLPDLRSTIDWEPNIVTDANGEAKLSFYTADKPSTYTLTIEGSDMNGNLGAKAGKIVVEGNKIVGK
jgi:hypothetical protein